MGWPFCLGGGHPALTLLTKVITLKINVLCLVTAVSYCGILCDFCVTVLCLFLLLVSV